MAGRLLTVCVVFATACAAPVLLARQASASGSQRVQYAWPTSVISPVVVGTWWTEQRGTEPVQLRLLVLWRGTPGWFQRPGRVSATGVNGRIETQITYGDVQLTLRYDPVTHVATINGEAVEMAGDNVVFVDDVDASTGPRVVGTTSVESAMPGSAAQIGQVLQRSAEVMAFLRCDATSSDARVQARLARICLERIGVLP